MCREQPQCSFRNGLWLTSERKGPGSTDSLAVTLGVEQQGLLGAREHEGGLLGVRVINNIPRI